ncbi:hypothetical protein LOC69_26790 [Blastopirellula sp. JC733]|nr:hypothetical protein [Blastopirellula sediminis]
MRFIVTIAAFCLVIAGAAVGVSWALDYYGAQLQFGWTYAAVAWPVPPAAPGMPWSTHAYLIPYYYVAAALFIPFVLLIVVAAMIPGRKTSHAEPR